MPWGVLNINIKMKIIEDSNSTQVLLHISPSWLFTFYIYLLCPKIIIFYIPFFQYSLSEYHVKHYLFLPYSYWCLSQFGVKKSKRCANTESTFSVLHPYLFSHSELTWLLYIHPKFCIHISKICLQQISHNSTKLFGQKMLYCLVSKHGLVEIIHGSLFNNFFDLKNTYAIVHNYCLMCSKLLFTTILQKNYLGQFGLFSMNLRLQVTHFVGLFLHFIYKTSFILLWRLYQGYQYITCVSQHVYWYSLCFLRQRYLY